MRAWLRTLRNRRERRGHRPQLRPLSHPLDRVPAPPGLDVLNAALGCFEPPARRLRIARLLPLRIDSWEPALAGRANPGVGACVVSYQPLTLDRQQRSTSPGLIRPAVTSHSKQTGRSPFWLLRNGCPLGYTIEAERSPPNSPLSVCGKDLHHAVQTDIRLGQPVAL